MGLRDDLERFREVGEQRREDLADFIQYGDLSGGGSDGIQIPVKIVSLPEFEYDQRDMGGVGQGEDGTPDAGQPVGQPQPQPGDDDGDDGDEPGEEGGEHEYYEMDPEEFAEELDEELGLDLDPKGKTVVEEKEGPFTDLTRTGPDSTLDFERMFKEGLKRKLAMDFDEEFLRELCKVEDIEPRDIFEWARGENLPVSMAWIEEAYDDIPDAERGTWASIEEVEEHVERESVQQKIRREGIRHVPFRREDERYRHPEIIEEKEKNVVVVNIRDVSGSMREKKRELVERTFTPLDWYLQGKYDNAEFVYIAHDADAWAVERDDFFGIRSGGGTKISSAYELAAELLEEYPWSDWNRYVFAAGDSENSSNDTEERVIPLMEEIPANLHAYVETQPSGNAINATHAEELERHFGTDADDVAVAYVNGKDDVTDAIYEILSTESETDE
ncbi:YeaH/YhbH family protein [Natronolimnohabitans sp. A-GB9]|uniref:YeaH/YhbH family protein n=1 Tax=Natronolimnohabitans sp. A-GB9 TaxID=3069757 RepID=UPI0027B4E9CC|nr:YeaH/YhbH family protein [Natronolimnohabitans sp. A-GB9]MDQ2048933.1 YeaH/YhbH family protein [Natronolimnohabitans sp. A-GB9]